MLIVEVSLVGGKVVSLVASGATVFGAKFVSTVTIRVAGATVRSIIGAVVGFLKLPVGEIVGTGGSSTDPLPVARTSIP